MRNPNLKPFILIGFILSTHNLAAQDLPSQQQIWPELEGYYRINERFRVYSLVSGTKTNSQYTDGTAGIYMCKLPLSSANGVRVNKQKAC
jgi:hypothetical protein